MTISQLCLSLKTKQPLSCLIYGVQKNGEAQSLLSKILPKLILGFESEISLGVIELDKAELRSCIRCFSLAHCHGIHKCLVGNDALHVRDIQPLQPLSEIFNSF